MRPQVTASRAFCVWSAASHLSTDCLAHLPPVLIPDRGRSFKEAPDGQHDMGNHRVVYVIPGGYHISLSPPLVEPKPDIGVFRRILTVTNLMFLAGNKPGLPKSTNHKESKRWPLKKRRVT